MTEPASTVVTLLNVTIIKDRLSFRFIVDIDDDIY